MVSSYLNEVKVWNAESFSLVKTYFKKSGEISSRVFITPDSK
jgi:hypothetical protein